MTKRILAVALALVMLLGTLLLTACNSTEDTPTNDDTTAAQNPSDTTAPVGGEEKEPTREDEAPVADTDYTGKTFSVLTLPDSSLFEGTSTDAQSISDAIARRTLYVEETFGIEWYLEMVDGREDYNTLQASYLGGDQLYDVIVPHPTINLAPLLMSGMLQDLNDSASFDGKLDTSKLWWNQSSVEAYNVNDKLFVAVCDLTLNKRGFSVVVLNKDKYDDIYQDEDIFDIIFDGEWTIQKMTDVATENYDENTEEYGFALNSGHVRYFFYSCGETLLKKDEDGKWVHKYDVEKVSKIVDKVYNLVIGPQTLQDSWYNSSFPECNAWKSFSEKNTMMIYMDLGAFGHMISALEFQTAFLPLPKLDTNQDKYYTEAGNGVLGIPNDAKDLEFCAVILEALNWHSYHNFRPVYFDSYLSVMVSKNENDYKVLEMLLNNSLYDLGELLDSAGLEPGRATGMFKTVIIDNLSKDVASYIEEHEEACNEMFQEYIGEIY